MADEDFTPKKLEILDQISANLKAIIKCLSNSASAGEKNSGAESIWEQKDDQIEDLDEESLDLEHSKREVQVVEPLNNGSLDADMGEQLLQPLAPKHHPTEVTSSNFVPGVFISNHLLDLYTKYGSLVDAQKVFDEMGNRDLCPHRIIMTGLDSIEPLLAQTNEHQLMMLTLVAPRLPPKPPDVSYCTEGFAESSHSRFKKNQSFVLTYQPLLHYATVDLDSLSDDLSSWLSKQSPGVPSAASAFPEYRTITTVLKAPHGDLISCMEMAEVADILAFVASASSACEETDSCFIDSIGDQCFSVFRSLGLPSTVVFTSALTIELKQRNELKKMCTSSIASEFPEDCKYYTKLLCGDNSEDRVLAFTVASVIEPFLSPQQHRHNIPQRSPELISGVQIDIMTEKTNDNSNQGTPCWLEAQLLSLVDILASAPCLQSLIEASLDSPEHDWTVGWSLASYSNDSNTSKDFLQTHGRLAVGGFGSASLMCKSLTRMAILSVSLSLKDFLGSITSSMNKRGDFLLAVGSPFEVLSPTHFFNSISVGRIVNCYPPYSSDASLLMVDIRSLPGLEGSPIFSENACLTGIMIRPLGQKTSGAEIQLVIPWDAIVSASSGLLQKSPQNTAKWLYNQEAKPYAAGNATFIDTGRQQALQVVYSWSPNGGTNIAEGLKKGAKVFVDRRFKNLVGSIMLLSDGKDNYTINSRPHIGTNYRALVSIFIQITPPPLDLHSCAPLPSHSSCGRYGTPHVINNSNPSNALSPSTSLISPHKMQQSINESSSNPLPTNIFKRIPIAPHVFPKATTLPNLNYSSHGGPSIPINYFPQVLHPLELSNGNSLPLKSFNGHNLEDKVIFKGDGIVTRGNASSAYTPPNPHAESKKKENSVRIPPIQVEAWH